MHNLGARIAALCVFLARGFEDVFAGVRNHRKQPTPQPAQCERDDRRDSIAMLISLDPLFSERQFVDHARNIFMNIQAARAAGRYQPMQGSMTDALYKHFARRLLNAIDAGHTIYVEHPAVLNCQLKRFTQNGDCQTLTVLLDTHMVEYTTDAGGQLISGSRICRRLTTYEYAFTRHTNEGNWMLENIFIHQ